MQITLKEITIRELTAGYADNQEQGVVGYNGKLDIRPPYQREFVYKPEQRNAVIETVRNGFPLNSIYWVKNGDTYEMLDGQQRTVSICQFVHGDFSIDDKYFHTLAKDEREQILDYVLHIYFCEGTDSDKLKWFKVINTAGEKLTDQELRNAIYTGAWLADAKSKFSKSNCAAYGLASKYIDGSPIRQKFLETALDWISDGNITGYMADHQRDGDAEALWEYFQNVIAWVQQVFPQYRKEMKGLDWGRLYNRFGNDTALTHTSLAQVREKQIKMLMTDDDVTNKKGIYDYVLTGNERCLNIRTFSDSMKRSAYERQNGVCPYCKETFDIDKMEGDHITPWSQGGKTVAENCQMLCKDCNRRKAGK